MDTDPAVPYGKRWRARAFADTRQYWTPVRATATVAGPIVAGILWGIFKPWGGWWPIMQIAAISVLGFFALWGLVFFVELCFAPAKLERQKQSEFVILIQEKQLYLNDLAQQKTREIADLNRSHTQEIGKWSSGVTEANNALTKCRELLALKHPADAAQEQMVEAAITKLDRPENDFVKWLLTMGSADNVDISKAGHHDTVLNRVIDKAAPVNLIKRISYRPGNGLIEMGYRCEINPELKVALRNVLFR